MLPSGNGRRTALSSAGCNRSESLCDIEFLNLLRQQHFKYRPFTLPDLIIARMNKQKRHRKAFWLITPWANMWKVFSWRSGRLHRGNWNRPWGWTSCEGGAGQIFAQSFAGFGWCHARHSLLSFCDSVTWSGILQNLCNQYGVGAGQWKFYSTCIGAASVMRNTCATHAIS